MAVVINPGERIDECSVRWCSRRQIWFNVMLWTSLSHGISIVAGERPELHAVPPIVPFDAAPETGSNQRLDILHRIEEKDEEGFGAERERANAEIDKLRRDQLDREGSEHRYELHEDEEEGGWNFQKARENRVLDGELRQFAENPRVEPFPGFKGPWFSTARAQKQELEYGVERLKNASRFMSWQSEEAYRRLANLESMVAGYTDSTGTKKGLAEALKTSDAWIDKIADRMPKDIKQVSDLAGSYLNLKVFGEDMGSENDVYKSQLTPRDEVTLEDVKDDNKYQVRFYRRLVDGKCELHKDVTKPSTSILFTGICGDPKDAVVKKIESWEWTQDYRSVTTKDDCGGEHQFLTDSQEAEVLALVEMGHLCGVVMTGDTPTIFAPIFADKSALKQQVSGVTPYKYYNYLLEDAPKREDLDHRLELPVEMSQIPDN